LIAIQSYAKVCSIMTSQVLIQTHVSRTVLRKLDTLAKQNGHKRAGYLRYIVELHIGVLTPQQTQPEPHLMKNTTRKRK
jgi:hypothetical protein